MSKISSYQSTTQIQPYVEFLESYLVIIDVIVRAVD